MDSCSEGVSLEGYRLEFFDLAFVWLRSVGEITQTRRRANKWMKRKLKIGDGKPIENSKTLKMSYRWWESAKENRCSTFLKTSRSAVRRRAHQQKLAAVRISASATRKDGGDSKRSKWRVTFVLTQAKGLMPVRDHTSHLSSWSWLRDSFVARKLPTRSVKAARPNRKECRVAIRKRWVLLTTLVS